MKKVILAVAAGCLFCSQVLMSEPLILEQANNVLKAGTLEIGVTDSGYQRDVTSIVDHAGNEALKLTNTETWAPLFARYALANHMEATMHIPYISLNFRSEIGGVSTSSSHSGLGDTTLAAKMGLLDKAWKMGIAAGFSLPTGNTTFRKGLGITPLIALRRDFQRFLINMNFSYDITGGYDDAPAKVKVNPADVLSAGLGSEIPDRKIQGLAYLAEFIYQALSASTIAGVTQSGSSGNRLDAGLGLRYNTGNWKTKIGLALALGEEKYRTYDYKILLGFTYLIKL